MRKCNGFSSYTPTAILKCATCFRFGLTRVSWIHHIITTSFTASPMPSTLVCHIDKVHKKFPSASIASRLSMANIIFLGCTDKALATWQMEDMLLALTATVKMACFATSLALLFACLILLNDYDTLEMISRCAIAIRRGRTYSGRSDLCFSRTRLRTSFYVFGLGHCDKPASMALEIWRATFLRSLFSMKSASGSSYSACSASSLSFLKFQHFTWQSLCDSNLTASAKVGTKWGLWCGPTLEIPSLLSFTFWDPMLKPLFSLGTREPSNL